MLSLVVPGAGQIYCGKINRGLWTVIVFAGCVTGIALTVGQEKETEGTSLLLGLALRTAIVLYGFAFLDAFRTAREVSSGQDRLIALNPRVAATWNLLTNGLGYYYLGEKKRGVIILLIVGALSRVATKVDSFALDIFVEFVRIGLAADAFRLARKLIPPQEVAAVPYREEKRDVLAAAAYGLAGLLVAGYFGLAALGHMAPEEKQIDRSQETFDYSNGQSICRTGKYGITVRLPGTWGPKGIEPEYFCHWSDDEQKNLEAFVTRETVLPTTSLESYASNLRKSLLAEGNYTIEDKGSTIAGGRPARMMTIRMIQEDVEVHQVLLIEKKGFTAYTFVATSTDNSSSHWKRLLDSLPKVLEIN